MWCFTYLKLYELCVELYFIHLFPIGHHILIRTKITRHKNEQDDDKLADWMQHVFARSFGGQQKQKNQTGSL